MLMDSRISPFLCEVGEAAVSRCVFGIITGGLSRYGRVEIAAYKAMQSNRKEGFERSDGVLSGGTGLHISHREIADERNEELNERSEPL